MNKIKQMISFIKIVSKSLFWSAKALMKRIHYKYFKWCPKCKKYKLRQMFYKNICGSGGRQSSCNSCSKKNTAIWVEKNRSHVNSYMKDWMRQFGPKEKVLINFFGIRKYVAIKRPKPKNKSDMKKAGSQNYDSKN